MESIQTFKQLVTSKLFETFLVETGLNCQFLSNLRKFSHLPSSADCPDLGRLMYCDPMDYVSIAFTWRDTPEGLDYWYLVDVTWTDLLKGNFSFDDAKARIKAMQNLVEGLSRDAKTRIRVIQNLAAELSR